MLVRALGPIEGRSSVEHVWAQLPPQQRLVLALLVADLGRVCRVDRLVEALWGEQTPASGRRRVQGLISRLRGVLEVAGETPTRLRTVPGGWLLDLDDDAVDLTRFEALVCSGGELADGGYPEQARRRLEEAAALWRGRPFGELADHPALVADTIRLEEQYLVMRERLLQLRLDAGEGSETVAELQQLVLTHPLREGLWGLLMQALYRSGRQADALAAYQELRDREVDELGAEPGPELQRLHQAILRQELPAPRQREVATAAPAENRRAAARWPCRRDLPFVGREDELTVLGQAVEEAREDRRRFVLVAGEPGVGKTRLVAELADVAAGGGSEVLVGHCAEGAGVPFQPFAEALRADVDARADDDLDDRLGGHAGELSRLVPELAERTGQTPPPVSTSPELDQHRLFDAVAGWLAAASAQASLVLVVEDLHAATRPTLLMLRHLVRAGTGSGTLVVVTYRDTVDARSVELVEVLAELAHHPDVSHVQLDGLAPAAVADLVDASLGERPDARQGWAEAIHAATAGNALFVQELLASVGGQTASEPGRLLDASGVPWSLRRLLEARLQRLDRDTLRFLEHAGMAGGVFEFPVVAEAVGLSEDEALDALEQAIAARLVIPADGRRERYAFSHAVMRYALLDQLSRSRRMRLHARLAAALERRHPHEPAGIVSELAYHHTEAGALGEPAKALAFAQAAGDAAAAQLAHDEAAAHYQTAVELFDAQNPHSTASAQRCDLLTALGEAQQRAGLGIHSETLLDAIRLAVELADAGRIARAAWVGNRGFPRHLFGVDEERVAVLERAVEVIDTDAVGARATVLAVLAGELTFASDPTRPRSLSDEALALARHADETVLARVLALRQFTILHPSTVAERLANTAELIELVDRLDDPNLQVFARWWRAVAALQAADRSEADACLDEACRLAEALGEPFMGCASLMLAANRELLWGELDEVAKLMDRYYELGQLSDAVDIKGPYTFHQAWLLHERGRLDEALPALEARRPRYGAVPHWEAVTALFWWEAGHRQNAVATLERFAAEDFASVPSAFIWGHTMCSLAELAAAAEHRPAARRLRELLAPYADQLSADAAVCTGPVAYYLGLLAAALEDWDAATGYFEQAGALSDHIGAIRWANRVALARARLLLARDRPGDRETAVELLQATAAAARREGQTAVEEACEDLRRTDLTVG